MSHRCPIINCFEAVLKTIVDNFHFLSNPECVMGSFVEWFNFDDFNQYIFMFRGIVICKTGIANQLLKLLVYNGISFLIHFVYQE